MSSPSQTYQLVRLLLDRLEGDGQTFGVDTHLRLSELLRRLPTDYPPVRLKTILAPILAKNKEEQQTFYDHFEECWQQVQALQAKSVTPSEDDPAAQEERRWRLLAIVLGLFLLLGTGWLARQCERVESDDHHIQTVGLYDLQPAYVRGDTLLAEANQASFLGNPQSDSLITQHVRYRLADSLRVILIPLDTVGSDSIDLMVYNAAGDSLRWTLRSVLSTRPAPPLPPPITAQQPLFQPIDSLPYPHDIFSLAYVPPTRAQQVLYDYWPWIIGGLFVLATALLLAILVWRERRRRKLVAELEQRTQPPYIWDIKFAQPAEIHFGERFGLLLNQMRQRTTAESRELDVSATIDATVEGAGIVDFRYRQRTRPPEYLLLIDEQSRHNHRARLFDELYRRFLAEEVIISRYFYHGDVRLCFNEEHPHGIPLQDLAGKYPDTRLLLLGSGQSLISPLNGRLARWSELLTRWEERALLSPVPTQEWDRREEQLGQLLPVLPANLRSLSFLIDQLDAGEEGELDRWRQATQHQPQPQLALTATGLLDTLKTHYEPELLHWIAACAVYPRLQFELTCQLGQLLSPPEQPLLTSVNLNRINQLPWFVEGQMPPAVRFLLLDYLERERPALLQRVRSFLYTSLAASTPPDTSVAASEHRLQLALNEWFFTQDAKRKAELERQIKAELQAGAEADFTVIKFLESERGPLDFIVPDSWKRYLSYSDYPSVDWGDLKRDLGWGLPVWLILTCCTVFLLWRGIELAEGCDGEQIMYEGQTLCLDSATDELLYYERLVLDAIEQKDLQEVDSLSVKMTDKQITQYKIIHFATHGVPPQDSISNDNLALVRAIELGMKDDEATLRSDIADLFSISKEVPQNVATALYNTGIQLRLQAQDSACQYFTRATQIDLESANTIIWQQATYWCENGELPPANFSVSQTECCIPCEITLANNSANLEQTFWYFDNKTGNTAFNALQAILYYNQPGEYEVGLLVTTDSGVDTLKQTITVRDCTPLAGSLPRPSGPGECRILAPVVRSSLTLRNRPLSQAELNTVQASTNGTLSEATRIVNIPRAAKVTLYDSTALHYLVTYEGSTGYIARYFGNKTVLMPCPTTNTELGVATNGAGGSNSPATPLFFRQEDLEQEVVITTTGKKTAFIEEIRITDDETRIRVAFINEGSAAPQLTIFGPGGANSYVLESIATQQQYELLKLEGLPPGSPVNVATGEKRTFTLVFPAIEHSSNSFAPFRLLEGRDQGDEKQTYLNFNLVEPSQDRRSSSSLETATPESSATVPSSVACDERTFSQYIKQGDTFVTTARYLEAFQYYRAAGVYCPEKAQTIDESIGRLIQNLEQDEVATAETHGQALAAIPIPTVIDTVVVCDTNTFNDFLIKSKSNFAEGDIITGYQYVQAAKVYCPSMASEVDDIIAQVITILTSSSSNPENKQGALENIQPASVPFIAPTMVPIPGGTFEMGDTFDDHDYDNERPVHTVQISSFQLSSTEVTFAEYDLFCEATGREKPSDEGWGRDQRPVINVTWYDAVSYCNWSSEQQGYTPVYTIDGDNVDANWNANGYRLPTEAEWEYAARQRGQRIRFGNGKDVADLAEINFDSRVGGRESYSVSGEYRNKTIPVGSLNTPNNRGLHDMTGNVWEWCWDCYNSEFYENSPVNNPRGVESSTDNVIRGGGWNNHPQVCRAAFRIGITPSSRDNNLGFRVARNL